MGENYFLLFYQLFDLYLDVGYSVDRDLCFLIYVMAAIPVQLLMCGSNNYFEYWYKIIINHKTAPHVRWCLFLSADMLEFGLVSFRERNTCIVWHLGSRDWLEWGQRSLPLPCGSFLFSSCAFHPPEPKSTHHTHLSFCTRLLFGLLFAGWDL